jgi:hypothetical protein
MLMHPTSPEKVRREETESLFRRFVLPEEDKPYRTEKGWRWFRSENIIDLVRILHERGKLRDRT